MSWPTPASPVNKRKPRYDDHAVEYKSTIAHGQPACHYESTSASLHWSIDDFRSNSYSQLFSFPWARDTLFKLEFLLPNEKSAECRLNLRVVKGCDHFMDLRVMIIIFDETKREICNSDEDMKFTAKQDYRRGFRHLRLSALLNKEGYVNLQRLSFTIMVKSKQDYNCIGERIDLKCEKAKINRLWNGHNAEILELSRKCESLNKNAFGLHKYPKYSNVLLEPDVTFYIGSLPNAHKQNQLSLKTNQALIRKASPIWAAMLDRRAKSHILRNVDLVFDGRLPALQSLIHLITYGSVDCSDEVLHEVLLAAEKYHIYGARDYCEKKFIESLNSHNLARRLCLTSIFERTELLKKCVEWMNSSKFVQSSVFKTIIEKLPGDAYSRIANELLRQYLNRTHVHQVTSSGDNNGGNNGVEYSSEGDTFHSTEMTLSADIHEEMNTSSASGPQSLEGDALHPTDMTVYVDANEELNSSTMSDSPAVDVTQYHSADSSIDS